MLSALDLFSGAGGFSHGMQSSGVRVVGAIENDRFAAETYRKNHLDTTLLNENILRVSDRSIQTRFSGVDILFGGPPCQGFSVAGPSQYGVSDKRNELIFQFERVARLVRPEFIVVENVKGILNGRIGARRGALLELSRSLEELGYHCTIVRVKASEFGVPQTRERVFLLGRYKQNLIGFQSALESRKVIQAVSAWEAISDLPQINSGEGTESGQSYGTRSQNQFQVKMRVESSRVFNHVAMKHTARIIERLLVIRPGQSLKDVPQKYGQRKRNSCEIDKTTRYKMNCYRLDPDSPAITLPANFQTIHVHPHLDRMGTSKNGPFGMMLGV